MTRAMKFTSLTLALIASGNAQDTESYWSQQVHSDKQALGSAISNMESVAKEYRQAAQNHTHAKRLSLNLAEAAYGNAHDAAKNDKQNAMTDFNNALTGLKSAAATGRKDAEKAARQKSDQVDKVYRQEGEDARRKLKTQRSDASKKVSDAYDQTRAAANKLKRDSKSLERAMRRNGRSEHEYESMSQHLEQHAEAQRDYAEDNKDRAADAVEHIFEGAQDHLNDREEHQKERAADDRERAIEQTLDSLARREAAQASPVASALNLYAKTDASLSKEQQRQMEEQDAQSAVDSDKSRISHAMQQLDKVAQGFQRSVKNSTHAEALAANIAKGVFNEAAKSSMAEKEKATKDFNSYLDALKSSAPTGKWDDALKTVKEQARYLDRLDRKEEKDAREMLRRKHRAQQKTVKTTYHSAHRAASHLLEDKDRLENAMRHAGAKEREYEGQEERNEAFGERNEDRSEDLNDNANDAAEEIYERASDNLHALQHANHKEQHEASHYRREQIHDAVMTLQDAAKGKTYTQKTVKRGGDAASSAASSSSELAKGSSSSELASIQKQMENLQKGISPSAESTEELLVSPVDFSSSCLLAVASVGLLIAFSVRRTRPSPVAPPLLG